MNSIVVVVYGYPASGKSTFSNKLVQIIHNSVLLSNDAIRHELNLPLIGKEYTDQVYSDVAVAAYNHIQNGKTPICDATYYLREYREILFKKLKSLKPYYIFYKINTSLAICKDRVYNRKLSTNNRGIDDISIFDKVTNEFQDISKGEIEDKHLIINVEYKEAYMFNTISVANPIDQKVEALLLLINKSINYGY